METKYTHKTFSFTVDTPGISYKKKFDLDKNIRVVTGLLISGDDPKKVYYRGSQRIELNGEELYPEDFESKLLMSGISVSPSDKFADLGNGVLAGNGELKILYKDTENTVVPFEPYKVSVVLKCELQ